EEKPDWLPGFPVQIYCNSSETHSFCHEGQQFHLILRGFAHIILSAKPQNKNQKGEKNHD
ncbi:hypothetical protein, partial [Agathobaculum sp.]|uniref:hypothetical protein n=1 Tax=Agathobaculum sp. TaxID=2048138 RepID=UPI0027B928E0